MATSASSHPGGAPPSANTQGLSSVNAGPAPGRSTATRSPNASVARGAGGRVSWRQGLATSVNRLTDSLHATWTTFIRPQAAALWAQPGSLLFSFTTISSLGLAGLALWPAITGATDTREARLLAEWTALKDFYELCESHDWALGGCAKVRSNPPGPPPSLPRQWGHETSLSWTTIVADRMPGRWKLHVAVLLPLIYRKSLQQLPNPYRGIYSIYTTFIFSISFGVAYLELWDDGRRERVRWTFLGMMAVFWTIIFMLTDYRFQARLFHISGSSILFFPGKWLLGVVILEMLGASPFMHTLVAQLLVGWNIGTKGTWRERLVRLWAMLLVPAMGHLWGVLVMERVVILADFGWEFWVLLVTVILQFQVFSEPAWGG